MSNFLTFRNLLALVVTLLAAVPAHASQPLTGVVQIAAGYDYSCALTATGTVLCWGTNQAGQLGDGSTTARELAKPVSGIGQATAIAVGYQHSCAIDAGLVKCWGQNDYGQLGPGSMNPSLVPFTVPGITGATAVAVSYSHTCALVGGAVKCWGANKYGQVGNGSSSTVVATPFTAIPSGATAIAAAAKGQTCAIVGGGAVQCWGLNSSGQLGTGDNNDRLLPATIIPSGASFITMGVFHSCAIVAGTLNCWGNNSHGELGTGNQTQSLVPTATQGLSGSVTAVATGQYHTCAIINNGSTQCWGQNYRGQLGIGTLTEFDYRTVPQTSTVSGASALAAGAEFSCAIVAGAVKCWGSNLSGQLGNGVTEAQPVHVVAIPVGANATAISSRQDHGCAVVNGAVKCWGHNPSGQLGDGTTLARATPVGVSGLVSGATAVAAGGEHSCAIVAGAVKCWGSNARGQLGSGGPATPQTTPVNVAGLTTGVTAIAAGSEHTCALKGGQVSCWGDNLWGPARHRQHHARFHAAGCHRRKGHRHHRWQIPYLRHHRSRS
ncbi:MAG: RCC1 repeat-containing protein [Comamonadaceae bacterium]|nr:RCC1 repeat-containing protein [Comamonadaceae bacterium]